MNSVANSEGVIFDACEVCNHLKIKDRTHGFYCDKKTECFRKEINMADTNYNHGNEIIVSSLEELKNLANNMPDGVVLSILIDEEEYYG